MITAQAMHELGPDRVARFAREMGVDRSPLQAVPSLALGQRWTPVFIERIVDHHGLTRFVADTQPLRVLDEGHAAPLVDRLRSEFAVKGDIAGYSLAALQREQRLRLARFPEVLRLPGPQLQPLLGDAPDTPDAATDAATDGAPDAAPEAAAIDGGARATGATGTVADEPAPRPTAAPA